MELKTAISLIEKGVNPLKIAIWADLGAGDGLFTQALSTLLHKGSVINAVDKKVSAMAAISLPTNDVILNKVGGDFETLSIDHLDGVLMANSLHFVKDQSAFLRHLRTLLLPQGQLVIVEYDSTKGNMWVPYPISFEMLDKKVISAGFKGAIKLHEVPSRFGRTNIYSAKIE